MNFINKIKAKLLTKWFTEWVRNEYDLEMLKMTKSMISTQEVKIKTIIDMSNRVIIKGYRWDEQIQIQK
jgi:hypothetical protein